MNAAGRSNSTKFRGGVIAPLLNTGLLELTIRDNPRSRLQKYRLTQAGERALREWTGGN